MHWLTEKEMNTQMRIVLLSAVMSLGCLSLLYGAAGGGDAVTQPNPASQPFAASPAAPGALPAAGLPPPPALTGGNAPSTALPGPAAVPGAAPGGAPAAGGAVPTPPPLVNLGAAVEPAAPGTTQALAAAQGPIESYQFLFREDPDLGVVREKVTESEAQQRRNAEIQRFMPKYGMPAQGAPAGMDPRAGAEWDLYFEQLQLYNQYVHEQVLEGSRDLPEPTYDPANYLTERTSLWNDFNRAAIAMVNDQHNENLDFYDRLKTREDRRRRYYEWLASQQRNLDEWAMIWARKVGGQRWAGDQAVRLDDWYYGVNFAAGNPTAVQIDGQSYLFSQEPQRRVPGNQLNVISSNLTPYDIVDRSGTLKTPELERLRGLAVHAPAEAPTTGVIEMAQ